MSRYAANTETSVTASRAEIEKTITRYGGDDFTSGQSVANCQAFVQFLYRERRIEFRIPLPNIADNRFQETPTGYARNEKTIRDEWEKACRQQWRVLLLFIKAGLEAVENGMPVEKAFLAWLTLPDGGTIGERVMPRLKALLAGGPVKGLLDVGIAKESES